MVDRRAVHVLHVAGLGPAAALAGADDHAVAGADGHDHVDGVVAVALKGDDVAGPNLVDGLHLLGSHADQVLGDGDRKSRCHTHILHVAEPGVQIVLLAGKGRADVGGDVQDAGAGGSVGTLKHGGEALLYAGVQHVGGGVRHQPGRGLRVQQAGGLQVGCGLE